MQQIIKDNLACKCIAAPYVVNGAEREFRSHWCPNELEQTMVAFLVVLFLTANADDVPLRSSISSAGERAVSQQWCWS